MTEMTQRKKIWWLVNASMKAQQEAGQAASIVFLIFGAIHRTENRASLLALVARANYCTTCCMSQSCMLFSAVHIEFAKERSLTATA